MVDVPFLPTCPSATTFPGTSSSCCLSSLQLVGIPNHAAATWGLCCFPGPLPAPTSLSLEDVSTGSSDQHQLPFFSLNFPLLSLIVPATSQLPFESTGGWSRPCSSTSTYGSFHPVIFVQPLLEETIITLNPAIFLKIFFPPPADFF